MLPPFMWMSRTLSTLSWIGGKSSGALHPLYPACMPRMVLTPYWCHRQFVISRMMEFSPGQSPPQVTMAARTSLGLWKISRHAFALTQPLASSFGREAFLESFRMMWPMTSSSGFRKLKSGQETAIGFRNLLTCLSFTSPALDSCQEDKWNGLRFAADLSSSGGPSAETLLGTTKQAPARAASPCWHLRRPADAIRNFRLRQPRAH
mmetsp:Transcript_8830/g.20921  ORF Transcript_8830/g.20921 Transcript_8830/m.20921 type:complete len:206 (-) Transcript_8830:34-651(-)